MVKLVNKYIPNSEETTRGHLEQVWKKSTKHKEAGEPEHTIVETNNVNNITVSRVGKQVYKDRFTLIKQGDFMLRPERLLDMCFPIILWW